MKKQEFNKQLGEKLIDHGFRNAYDNFYDYHFNGFKIHILTKLSLNTNTVLIYHEEECIFKSVIDQSFEEIKQEIKKYTGIVLKSVSKNSIISLFEKSGERYWISPEGGIRKLSYGTKDQPAYNETSTLEDIEKVHLLPKLLNLVRKYNYENQKKEGQVWDHYCPVLNAFSDDMLFDGRDSIYPTAFHFVSKKAYEAFMSFPENVELLKQWLTPLGYSKILKNE